MYLVSTFSEFVRYLVSKLPGEYLQGVRQVPGESVMVPDHLPSFASLSFADRRALGQPHGHEEDDSSDQRALEAGVPELCPLQRAVRPGHEDGDLGQGLPLPTAEAGP